MFEKVNPQHPDKVADRVAGALVDLAYTRSEGGWAVSNPKIAVEVLIGHGRASVIVETDANITADDVADVVHRITGRPTSPFEDGDAICVVPLIVPQAPHLAENQREHLRCGDNGLLKGCPVSEEQRVLTALARTIYEAFPTDGKYILAAQPDTEHAPMGQLTICQSQATKQRIDDVLMQFLPMDASWLRSPATGRMELLRLPKPIGRLRVSVNPLGDWTGGPDVDTGATNRKLGSDLGDAVTGGGLHGKDLSKADVSGNIVAHMLAQRYGQVVTATCAIGDESITFSTADGQHRETLPFSDVVEQARLYVMTDCGSFERLAEWGLVRPTA